MTSGLRKAHSIIWICLIVIIPILLVLSVKSIREPLITDNDVTIKSTSNGEQTILENSQFLIGVKELNSVKHIRIILKKPLKSASSMVYGTLNNGTTDQFLGVIDKKGVYQFKADTSIKTIRIYDEIKKNNIIKLEL